MEFYKIPQEHPGYQQLLTSVADVGAASITMPSMNLRVRTAVQQAFNGIEQAPRARLQKLVTETLDHWAMLVLVCGSPDKALIHSARIRKDQAEITLLNHYVTLEDQVKDRDSVDRSTAALGVPYFPEQYAVGQPLRFQAADDDGAPVYWNLLVLKEFNILTVWREYCVSTHLVPPAGEERTWSAMRGQARGFLVYLRDMNYVTNAIVPTTVNLLSVMDPRNG